MYHFSVFLYLKPGTLVIQWFDDMTYRATTILLAGIAVSY